MWNFDIPVRYLRENFEREDRLAVVLIDRERNVVEQKFSTAEKIASPRYQAFLRATNASGADVYVSMNTIRQGVRRRNKESVEVIRHIYLDVDVGGRAAVDRIVTAEGMPNPHHILNTSPNKYQIVWSVMGFEAGNAEELLRSLAAQHEADLAVTDCSRVLRLPGFRNQKYQEFCWFVKDVHRDPAQRDYTPEDFPWYEIKPKPIVVGQPRTRFSGNGKVSQSERDWAYALRALRRGEPPATIQAQIEQFRPDKSSPRYYANRTVERAKFIHAHILRS